MGPRLGATGTFDAHSYIDAPSTSGTHAFCIFACSNPASIVSTVWYRSMNVFATTDVFALLASSFNFNRHCAGMNLAKTVEFLMALFSDTCTTRFAFNTSRIQHRFMPLHVVPQWMTRYDTLRPSGAFAHAGMSHGPCRTPCTTPISQHVSSRAWSPSSVHRSSFNACVSNQNMGTSRLFLFIRPR